MKDVKQGYGEMHWADGSVYKGFWNDGVQNGLGIIKTVDGKSKAGVFQDNVLIEMMYSLDQIQIHESIYRKPIPEGFREELTKCVEALNPRDSQNTHGSSLGAGAEEESMGPNTLLIMQTPHKSKAKKPRIITIPNDTTSTESDEQRFYLVDEEGGRSKDQVYLMRSNEKRKKKNEYVLLNDGGRGSQMVFLKDKKKRDKIVVLPERREKEYILVNDTPEKPDSPHNLVFHDFSYSKAK